MQTVSGLASAAAIASVVESLPPLCSSHGERMPSQDSVTASQSSRW
jgi:hypothetical protein